LEKSGRFEVVSIRDWDGRAVGRLERENVHEEKEKKWKEAFMFCFRYYLGKKLCAAGGNYEETLAPIFNTIRDTFLLLMLASPVELRIQSKHNLQKFLYK
jgi:hypothetical protein